jgi:hypothetical protein
MEDYEAFANELTELLKSLESKGGSSTRQKMLSGIEAGETLEAGNATQKSKQVGSVNQEMATNLTAKNIKLGNLTQEG